MMSSISSAAETGQRATRFSWFALAWLGALLLASYAPVLLRLVRQWDSDPDMGHGFFVPVVACFIVWQKRRDLLALTPAPNWGGFGGGVFGAGQPHHSPQ